MINISSVMGRNTAIPTMALGHPLARRGNQKSTDQGFKCNTSEKPGINGTPIEPLSIYP